MIREHQEQPLRQKMMVEYQKNNNTRGAAISSVDDDRVQEEQPLCQQELVKYERNNH